MRSSRSAAPKDAAEEQAGLDEGGGVAATTSAAANAANAAVTTELEEEQSDPVAPSQPFISAHWYLPLRMAFFAAAMGGHCMCGLVLWVALGGITKLVAMHTQGNPLTIPLAIGSDGIQRGQVRKGPGGEGGLCAILVFLWFFKASITSYACICR